MNRPPYYYPQDDYQIRISGYKNYTDIRISLLINNFFSVYFLSGRFARFIKGHIVLSRAPWQKEKDRSAFIGRSLLFYCKKAPVFYETGLYRLLYRIPSDRVCHSTVNTSSISSSYSTPVAAKPLPSYSFLAIGLFLLQVRATLLESPKGLVLI